ncbi:unnamed protein product [Diamesa hyperborea]
MWISIIACVVFVCYYYLKYVYSHWERYDDIKSITPVIPFGNLSKVVKKQTSFGLVFYDLYRQVNDKFVGVYLFFRPAILVRDLDLVRNILVNDFQHFHDRGVFCDPENDPFSASIFAMHGEQWKSLRQKLTPAFTSGKLKSMFPTLLDVGNELDKHLKAEADGSKVIESKDVFSRYVVDVVASVIFGVDVSTIKNPEHEFRQNGKKLGDPNIINALRGAAVFLCPKLIKFLGVPSLPGFMRKFCLDLVTDTIKHREENNVVRKDLMQFLIQLRNNADVNDTDWNIKNTTLKSLSYENIAAQVFLFYIAGTETSAATITFTLFELARNKELMMKLQNEIDEALKKNDGKLTYDLVNELPYLDLCVKETTRKYPALAILNRECTKDYPVPDSKFVIEKGTAIVISLMGLHRDPKHFPDPETYNPDRFAEATKDYNEKAFMPFGEGPRNCIAFRMGRMVAKVGIVIAVLKYNFEPTDYNELEFDTASVPLQAKNGINLKIMNR